MARLFFLGFIAGYAALSLPATAAPGDRIGSAVTVVDYVTAAYSKETRKLRTGDGVRQNELIEVGPSAKSELLLDDETKLALGPGSRLLLDKFVYDPNKTGNVIIINMVEGTFRFITGIAQKPSYVIRTPSAAITVRGTIFDVYVRKSGEAWVLLHEGGVSVCNDRGGCRVMDEPGRLMPITDTGELGNPVRWASLNGLGTGFFDQAFPFVRDVPSIDPNPVFTRDALLEPTSTTPDEPKTTSKKPAREADSEPSAPKDFKSIPAKKRRVVVQDDDEDVSSPPPRVRWVLPKTRVKVVDRNSDDKYERNKSDTGKKLVRAAAFGILAIGASRLAHRDYPSHPSGGDGIYDRMPHKSGLGGSILK